MVRAGELNLMTAGAGICHSEVSVESGALLHGVQLWVALPDADRDISRGFAHYVPAPVPLPGAVARVFLGELAGSRSPVPTFTPLLGAQLDLDENADLHLNIDPVFEHGVLCDTASVAMGETTLAVADLGYQGPGHAALHLRNVGRHRARVVLLGGAPFGEELLMWWNFVGRDHDDIVRFRRLWEDADARFGAVEGYRGSVKRLPAPPLPTTKLRPRPLPPEPKRKEPT